MGHGAYGTPLIVREGESPLSLTRLALGGRAQGADYDEAFIQQLAFDHPECLPVAEIDVAYKDMVPLCTELNTPAGPLDALYVTPTGRLVILEAKLWRNPESRRKVVAQILDYAKELAGWSYEDLQRELSRRLGRKGNVLFELVHTRFPDTEEIEFVDGVQQSLSRGRFLLLIVGDGIREGAGAIAEFLESVGSLEFTFGLVELALYRNPQIGLLVQPRVIARTVEFRRHVVVLPEGAQLEAASLHGGDDSAPELDDQARFHLEFWKEFLDGLRLDDVSQPPAKVTQTSNIYFSLPPSGGVVWVSAYFMKSKETVGVYFRTSKGAVGESVAEFLQNERDAIVRELGVEARFEDPAGRYSPSVSRRFTDVHAPENREAIKVFFAENLNLFINTFRPRLKRFAEEQE